MANAVQTGLNMLQVGALRMPFLFANMNGALLVGEGAYRTVKATLNAFGFNGENQVTKYISDHTPALAVQVLRPYQNLTNKQLAISALACCIIGTLGSELVSYVFGKAPAIYNNVLSWMGNIRITNDHHPLVQMAINRWS